MVRLTPWHRLKSLPRSLARQGGWIGLGVGVTKQRRRGSLPAPTAPVVFPQSITVAEDGSYTGQVGATQSPTSYATGSLPSHGVLSLNTSTGAFTYTPTANYNGSDSFTFTATNGLGTSAAATISITVSSVNDAPVSAGQSWTTNVDTAATRTLTATDIDSGSLTYSILSGPSHGTLSGFNASTGAFTYTPASTYSGPDSFTWQATDGALTSTATEVITVSSAPTLATKSAYSPVGDLGADGGFLKDVAGWAGLSTRTAGDAAFNTWRTYAGGLVGPNGGGYGLVVPGDTLMCRNTGSTNHVFRFKVASIPNGTSLQIVVAGSAKDNCAFLDLNTSSGSGFDGGQTGTRSIQMKKVVAGGTVTTLGGPNWVQAREVGRKDDADARLIKVGDTVEIHVLGQRVHVFINGKRASPQGGWDLDTGGAFIKGQYVGFGDWSLDNGIRLSNLYAAPITSALGLNTQSQWLDDPSFPHFWGGKPGVGRTIPIYFTWDTNGTKPTALRYRVWNESFAIGSVVQDWQWDSTAVINNDGTGICYAQVPMSDVSTNRQYRVQVGTYNDADACTMTARGAAVGYLVMIYGQSNAGGWAGAGATPFAHDANSYGWDGSNGWDGGDATANGVKSRMLADVLAPLLGVPVGVIPYGVSGRHIYELNVGDGSVSGPFPEFVDVHPDFVGDNAYLDNLVAFLQDYRVQCYGVAQQVVWVQGEAETADPSMTEALYRGHFNTLLANMRGSIVESTVPFNICTIGSFRPATGDTTGDPQFLLSKMRAVLSRLTTLSNVRLAASNIDLPLDIDGTGSGIHYTPDGVVEEARRVGLSLAQALSLTTVGGRGPIVTGAARAGSTITLSLNLNGSTGLAAQSGLSAYEVNSAADWSGTTYTVSSAAVSGNTIVLGLGSAPPGPVYVRSLWVQDATNGTVFAKGNYTSAPQIPVEPIYTPLLSN